MIIIEIIISFTKMIIKIIITIIILIIINIKTVKNSINYKYLKIFLNNTKYIFRIFLK